MNFNDFAHPHTRDGRLDLVKDWQNVFHAVADVHDHNCTDTNLCKILLEAEAVVCREDYSETAIDSRPQQNTISKALEFLSPDNRALEFWQERLDLLWNGLVNEQPQRPLPPLVQSQGLQWPDLARP